MTTKSRMIIVGVIAPLVYTAGGIIAILGALPRLPDTIAVHWGASGGPDGFGSPIGSIVLLGLLGIAFATLGFAASRLSDGIVSSAQRFILALTPSLAGFLAWVLASSIVLQAGLADGHDAPSILPTMLAAVVIAVVLWFAAWFALPRPVAPPARERAELPVIELGADERVSWIQYLEPSRAVGTLVVGILAVALVGGGVAMALLAPTPAFVIWTVVMVLAGALAVSSLFWAVSIDRRGLIVRSVLGFPRFAITPAEVGSATTTDVVPLRDFGGWGIRGIGRRVGVVIRAGEAIEVTRKDGRVFIVTVPQAARGAALLNAVAARA